MSMWNSNNSTFHPFHFEAVEVTMGTATHRHSVLVVEDNEDLVIGLQDLLHHDGYTVTVTGTVAGAIELVRTHHFNAVLLDLGLPDGDGLEVLQEAQRLDPYSPRHDRDRPYLRMTAPWDR